MQFFTSRKRKKAFHNVIKLLNQVLIKIKITTTIVYSKRKLLMN